MVVPKMSQLSSGLPVNIVLKADQRSGKLSTGQISEILTQGDHPRGIKVRLFDGRVGRVQSFAASSSVSHDTPLNPTAYDPFYGKKVNGQTLLGKSKYKSQKGRFGMQEDYRSDPTPLESRSLADYIRPSPPSKTNERVTKNVAEQNAQTKLESEFPQLDSALIAAILADHEKVEDAREVLVSLST